MLLINAYNHNSVPSFVEIYVFHHYHHLTAGNNGSRCAALRLFSRREMCYHLPLLEEGNTRLHEATNVI